MKQRADWLSRALYISPVRYGLCVTEPQFHAELKRLKVPRKDWPPYVGSNHADATAHHFDREGQVCIVVTIKQSSKATREEIYGLLVHEGVHVWQIMRAHMGEHSPAVEQEAYAIQTIAQELMVSYRDQTKRK